MRRLSTFAGLAMIAGCMDPTTSNFTSSNEPTTVSAPFLSEQEIRVLLGNTPVILQPAPVDGAEIFYPDGRYVSESRGAFLQGRYEISPGQICVSILRYPPRCRSVFTGDAGEVRMGMSAREIAQSHAVTFEPMDES